MAKILLVDDVELFLELEKSLLLETGYELFTARSGEEVLERIDAIAPDLILLDLYMGGIDGDEVCRRLRQSEMWKALPIIMVTAAGKRIEVEKCLQAGCNDYITKPVSKQELIDKIQRLLGQVKSRRAPRDFIGVAVHVESDAWSGPARARDLSRNGIFIETDKDFAIGAVISITLELPGRNEVKLLGKVARVENEGEKGCGVYIVHHEGEDERLSGAIEVTESVVIPDRFEQKVERLGDENKRLEEEAEELRARIRELEEENFEFANQLVRTEEINNNLTNLYIASSRLHSVLDQSQVIDIIKEITINFIGAEKFTLLLRPKGSPILEYLADEGFEEGDFPKSIRVTENEFFGQVVNDKEIFLTDGPVLDGSDDPQAPLAVIPFVIHDEVTAVLAIYRLFEQKEKFEDIDHQLFSMMAEHAATAIFSSSLYEESERKRETYRGVMDLLLK
ncbi:MAG: hypothetical protein C0615_09685 [Desulfuromonas sp.]|nr:MAG: hypothetical protein C0615_09685 [Desulfuromonas sp.]